MGFERWLQTCVVSRIPGAKGGEDRLAGEPVQASPTQVHSPEAGGRLLSDLLGAQMRSAADDDLGTVLDVSAEAVAPTEAAVGVLRVRGLSFGVRATGTELGYTEAPGRGPYLLATVFRRLHRNHRYGPIEAVAGIDWHEGVVTLTRAARPIHPHER